MSAPAIPPVAPPTGPARPTPFARLRARVVIVAMLVVVAIAMIVGNKFVPGLRNDRYINALMLLAYIVMFMVLVASGWMVNLRWSRVLGPLPRFRELPLIGVVVPLGLITGATLVMLFVPLSYVAPDMVQHAILDDSPLDHIASVNQLALLFANVCVVAPIVEELLFRGFLLQRFAYKWGTSAGVVVSSALFAVGHAEWIGHFVTGLLFALIYVRTRSLWMSMLAHGTYNALFIVPLAWNFFTHQPPEVETMAEFRDSLGVGMLTFAAGAFLLWLYFEVYWKERTVSDTVAGDVPYDAG